MPVESNIDYTYSPTKNKYKNLRKILKRNDRGHQKTTETERM